MKDCFWLISKHPKCWQTYACLLRSCETHYLIGTNENLELSTDNKPLANQKQGRCFIPTAIKRNVFSKSTDSQALYIEILFAPKRQVHYKPKAKAIFSRRPGFAHSVMGTLTFQVLLAP